MHITQECLQVRSVSNHCCTKRTSAVVLALPVALAVLSVYKHAAVVLSRCMPQETLPAGQQTNSPASITTPKGQHALKQLRARGPWLCCAELYHPAAGLSPFLLFCCGRACCVRGGSAWPAAGTSCPSGSSSCSRTAECRRQRSTQQPYRVDKDASRTRWSRCCTRLQVKGMSHDNRAVPGCCHHVDTVVPTSEAFCDQQLQLLTITAAQLTAWPPALLSHTNALQYFAMADLSCL